MAKKATVKKSLVDRRESPEDKLATRVCKEFEGKQGWWWREDIGRIMGDNMFSVLRRNRMKLGKMTDRQVSAMSTQIIADTMSVFGGFVEENFSKFLSEKNEKLRKK